MKDQLQETTDEVLDNRLEQAGRKALSSVQKRLRSKIRNNLAELDRCQDVDAGVAGDFFPKIISSSAGKNSVIQCSPCYSAVSALSTNPLPDRSNYLPLLPHPILHSG